MALYPKAYAWNSPAICEHEGREMDIFNGLLPVKGCNAAPANLPKLKYEMHFRG